MHQRVESLSGDCQQLAAIARAISFDPRAITIDEPTVNLSVMATQRLLETMLGLKKHRVGPDHHLAPAAGYFRGGRPGHGFEAG